MNKEEAKSWIQQTFVKKKKNCILQHSIADSRQLDIKSVLTLPTIEDCVEGRRVNPQDFWRISCIVWPTVSSDSSSTFTEGNSHRPASNPNNVIAKLIVSFLYFLFHFLSFIRKWYQVTIFLLLFYKCYLRGHHNFFFLQYLHKHNKN